MSEIDLRLGDCLEILPTLPDNSVDAVITDIPYGTTACSWDEVIPFKPMWEQVKRITSLFITTASQPFTSRLIMSNLDWFKYELIWDKKSTADFLQAKRRPMKYHENILIFYSDLVTYNPQMWQGNKNSSRGNPKNRIFSKHVGHSFAALPDNLNGKKYPRSILEFAKHVSREKHHVSQKPVNLYKYLIQTYTNKGDTVLDFCFGSGTTGVACVQTGRNFIGIEIEPKYFEIAQKRIKEAQLQMIMDFA